LTLDLHTPPAEAGRERTPKIRIPSLYALSSRRDPTPHNPQIAPETRKSQTLSASRNAQATGPMNQPKPAQDRRPRIPSLITTMSNNNAAREPELHFLPCAAVRPYTSVLDPCQTNYAGMMTARPAIRGNRINSLIQRTLLD